MNSLPPKFRLFSTFLFALIIILQINLVIFSQTSEEEKDPVQIFNQAQDLHEKGDLINALKLYQEALEIAPEFPEAEFQKGNLLQSLGRLSEAETAFRQAIKLRENWVLPMVNLGEILVRKGQFTEAETLLKKAISLDETNTTAYLSLTELYLKTNASPENLKVLLNKLASFKNADASIWTARGAIEKHLGDKVSAQNSLLQALKLEPKNLNALAEMTDFLLAERKYDEALASAQNLVKYSPNSISSKILLARVYAESDKTAEANKILDTLDSQNSDVIKLRNDIVANTTKDIPTLEKELEKNPTNPVILGKLCLATRTIPAKALDFCRRASEAEPTNVAHAIGFGAALVQAKQFANAVNLLQKLLQFEPDNYSIHANLATAFFELKQYPQAIKEFQWLNAKKPDLAIAYYFLAISYDNLAEYEEALTNYQKFLQLADVKQNQLEIDKVNLRLPILEKQVKRGEGVKKRRKQ